MGVFKEMPLSLSRKCYLVVTLLMTVIMLFLSYTNASNAKQILLHQKERDLWNIAMTMDRQLPRSLIKLFAEENARSFGRDEQVRILNQKLQPIVNDIASQWPGYGLGYYSRDLRTVAAAPFDSFPGKRAAGRALAGDNTGRPISAEIDNGFPLEGNSILSLDYPLYYDGRIVGHIGANIEINDINNEFFKIIMQNLFIFLLLWLIMIGSVWLIFFRLKKSVLNFAAQIKTGRIDPRQMDDFPELLPLFHMIDRFRDKLQSEYEDKMRLRDEIARMDRLNLIGEMAAGVAHEIRNPMTVVMGYIQMILIKDSSEAAQKLSIVQEELKRINMIISRFLALARNKRVEKELCRLNDLLERLCPEIYAQSVKKGIQLMLKLANDLPPIMADIQEIKQLVLNLVFNGLEAIQQQGTLEIRTEVSDGKVRLVVADTGIGIACQDMERIFDPFFTTKSEGIGLGLTVCQSIVDRHQGQIRVDSKPGAGPTFTVIFDIAV